MKNQYFKAKNLVGKVVYHDKIGISTWNGVIVTKFVLNMTTNMVACVESQPNFYMVALFVKIFFLEISIL
jgi:hypothetical protein